jgi:hypothetical protein
MPKVIQQVSVEVQDRGVELGKRKVELTISAQSDLFNLSDMLVGEGAIQELDRVLKFSARRAVAEYIASGREFVKEVAARKKKDGARVEEKAGQDKRVAVQLR